MSAGRRTVTSLFVDGHEALEDIARFDGHAKPSTTAGYVERLGRRPEAVARRAAAVLDVRTDRSDGESVLMVARRARSRGSPNPAARRPGRTEDASNRSQAVARWPRPAPVHRPGPRGAAGEHLLVVSHRPKPDGWHPEADVPFFDDIPSEDGKRRAGDRIVALCAGVVGGQALALGLVDDVAMDVVPVVFGSGKRYFGPVDSRHLLDDPDVVIKGDRVLHLRYRVRR